MFLHVQTATRSQTGDVSVHCRLSQAVCLLLPWQDIGADLRSQRTLVSDTEQNLRLAKSSCENMANKFQEHCPDIERQEADVQKLNKRYNNLNQQTDSRQVVRMGRKACQ